MSDEEPIKSIGHQFPMSKKLIENVKASQEMYRNYWEAVQRDLAVAMAAQSGDPDAIAEVESRKRKLEERERQRELDAREAHATTAVWTAEVIVRDLASYESRDLEGNGYEVEAECSLCGGETDEEWKHWPSCPWIQARRWVEENS